MSKRPVVYIHRVEWCPYEYYMNDANQKLLASFADVRNFGDERVVPTPEQMAERLAGTDGLLLLNGAHVDEITADAIRAAGTVKVAVVSHWWEGLNPMLKGWEGAGMRVVDASNACSKAVAEWTIGAAIAGLRKFDQFDRAMKSGEQWPTWRGVAGQLNGSTFGLVALGRVGRQVLEYLKPFDVRILVHDPALKPEAAAKLGVEAVDLPTLLKTSDVISLHAPVIPQTKGMIGKKELAMIRDGALLLNCARAWLVDNDALKRELGSGRLRAYLDVFEPEPPTLDDPLRKMNNVVLTPHVAGTTDAMFLQCGELAIKMLRDALVK